MQALLDEICLCCDSGEKVALCTIVGSRGSTPQEKGAKMLVLADGKTLGTLGGGCVEAEVRKRAMELLSTDHSKLLEFNLNHDYGWDDGLICGGIMDVYVQVIDGNLSANFKTIRDSLASSRATQFRIDYELAARTKQYIEELGPPPMLIIAGAGHVGHALANLAPTLDFRVTVIDDRPDFMTPAAFPTPRASSATSKPSFAVPTSTRARMSSSSLAATVTTATRSLPSSIPLPSISA